MYDIEDNIITIKDNKEPKSKKPINNSILCVDIIFFSLFVSKFAYDNNLQKLAPMNIVYYAIYLNIYYTFHIFFSKQDFLHNIHHIVAIVHQCIFLYYTQVDLYGICMNYDFLQTMSIQYYMLITSVFSALRQLSKNKGWKSAKKLEYLYFYVFLTSKIGGNIVIWYTWYNNRFYKILLPCYIFQQYSLFVISIIQMYFSYKIIKLIVSCKHNKIKDKKI